MKKSILSLLLILALSISLSGCSSSSSKYLQVKANGKSIDLSGSLKETVTYVQKNGFLAASDKLGMVYDEDGELTSGTKFSYDESDNAIVLGSRNILDEANKPGSISSNIIYFEKKYLPDVSLVDGCSYSSSKEDLKKAGYSEWGNDVYFIVWADENIINLSDYEEKSKDLIINYDGEGKTYLLDKSVITEDEFKKYASGKTPVVDIISGYINNYASMKVLMQASGEEMGKLSEQQLDEAMVNSYEAYLASMELGQKLRDGKIKAYGAVFVSEKEIIVTKAYIEA